MMPIMECGGTKLITFPNLKRQRTAPPQNLSGFAKRPGVRQSSAALDYFPKVHFTFDVLIRISNEPL